MSIRLGVAILATVAALALPSMAAADHTFAAKWGSSGSGPGEVSLPSGIDADALDNVFVADFSNNRVQKFSPDGEFLAQWGTAGSADGQFNQPVDVAVDDSGNFYVADRANARVQKFNSAGVFQWKTQPGELSQPSGLATDGSAVYVTDHDAGTVSKFSSSGNLLNTWGAGALTSPTGLDVAGGTIYVTDTGNHCIQRLDSSSGVFGTPFGTCGPSAGTFSGPEDVAVSDGGDLFVADNGNSRVLQLESDGDPVPGGEWGGSPSGPFVFADGGGVATGSLDSFFVSDASNNRIQKFAKPLANSTVRVSGTRIVFEGDGSASVATVSLAGTVYTFTDTDTITRGAGCAQVNAVSVTCDAAGLGIQSLRFLLGGGNDTLTVNPTTPTSIEGGSGDDAIAGSAGASDVVTYGTAPGPVTVTLATPGVAQDTLNAGDDTLTGIEGITGGDSGDTLTGNSGANVLTGGLGNDTLLGAGGDDTLAGGTGTDRASYADAASGVSVDLSLSGAQDTLGAGNDTLSGIEDLTGSAQGDVLAGSSAANSVQGGNGNDDIRVADSGADQADCGGGTDTATVDAQDTTSACETVTIAGAGGGGGTGGDGGTGGTPTTPGAGGGGGTTPLVLSRLGASKMRSGKRGSFRYTLTLAARVTLTIARPGPGRKVGSSCRKQTRKNRKKRRCAFYAAIANLTHAGKPGANTVPFSGKVKGKAMKRGTYRVTAVAVSPSGVKSASVSAAFKVTR